MKRRRLFLIVVGITLIALGAGLGIAQSLKATPLVAEVAESWKQASDRVILVVDGQPVTEKGWMAVYPNVRLNPRNAAMSDRDAKILALRTLIEQNAIYAEAISRGFQASLEEAQQYAQEQRKLLQSPAVVPESLSLYKDFIQALGVSEDEYWQNIAPPVYRGILTENKLRENIRQAVPPPTKEEMAALQAKHPEWSNISQEALAQMAAQEKFDQVWQEFQRQIVKKAKIEVLAPDLKDLLGEALSP
jgi:hypothetical protein